MNGFEVHENFEITMPIQLDVVAAIMSYASFRAIQSTVAGVTGVPIRRGCVSPTPAPQIKHAKLAVIKRLLCAAWL